MCYNQTGDISTLDGTSMKLVDKFTYLESSVSLTEKDIDTRLTKAWTANDRLSIIWKSDQTDKMKRSFFRAAVVSILLYGCTTLTLTKRLGEKARQQLHMNIYGGARGVIVIVVGNEHSDTSSNPGREWFAFHIALIPLGKV